jgi:hypothetical protein
MHRRGASGCWIASWSAGIRRNLGVAIVARNGALLCVCRTTRSTIQIVPNVVLINAMQFRSGRHHW